MRTLPSDFNGFRLANSKFGFVITLKGLVSLSPSRLYVSYQPSPLQPCSGYVLRLHCLI